MGVLFRVVTETVEEPVNLYFAIQCLLGCHKNCDRENGELLVKFYDSKDNIGFWQLPDGHHPHDVLEKSIIELTALYVYQMKGGICIVNNINDEDGQSTHFSVVVNGLSETVPVFERSDSIVTA